MLGILADRDFSRQGKNEKYGRKLESYWFTNLIGQNSRICPTIVSIVYGRVVRHKFSFLACLLNPLTAKWASAIGKISMYQIDDRDNRENSD